MTDLQPANITFPGCTQDPSHAIPSTCSSKAYQATSIPNYGEYERYPALSSKSKPSVGYGNDLIPLHDPTDLLDRSRRVSCNALFGKYYLSGFSKRGYEYAFQGSTFHMELGSKRSIPPSRLHAMTPLSHRTPLHLLPVFKGHSAGLPPRSPPMSTFSPPSSA